MAVSAERGGFGGGGGRRKLTKHQMALVQPHQLPVYALCQCPWQESLPLCVRSRQAVGKVTVFEWD